MFLKTRLNIALSFALVTLSACSGSNDEQAEVDNVVESGSAQSELSFNETVEGKAVLRAKAEAELAAKVAAETESEQSDDLVIPNAKVEFSDNKKTTTSKQTGTTKKEKYVSSTSGNYPRLVLTEAGVDLIKKSGSKSPTFTKELNLLKAEIDLAIESPIDVPVPKDAGGGYTHEQHKRNYKTIYGA